MGTGEVELDGSRLGTSGGGLGGLQVTQKHRVTGHQLGYRVIHHLIALRVQLRAQTPQGLQVIVFPCCSSEDVQHNVP